MTIFKSLLLCGVLLFFSSISRLSSAEVIVQDLKLESQSTEKESEPSLAEKSNYSFKPNELEWFLVDRWLDAERSRESFNLISQKLAPAKANEDMRNWGEALVRGAQARGAEQGRAAAIDWLNNQELPPLAEEQFFVINYRLHLLIEEITELYPTFPRRGSSGTSIRRRSLNETSNLIDKDLQRIWELRDAWSHLKATEISYFQAGDFPPGISESILEGVMSTWREWEFWKFKNLNPKSASLPELQTLLAGVDVKGFKVHQAHVEAVKRLKAAGMKDASLQLELDWVNFLNKHFHGQADKQQLADYLISRVGTYIQSPWWSVGQFETAKLLIEVNTEEALNKAYHIAKAGHSRYPTSYGGTQCKTLLEELESEHLQVEFDESDKSKLQIETRNLNALLIEVYKVNIEDIQKYPGLLRDVQESIRNYLVDSPATQAIEIAVTGDSKLRQNTIFNIPSQLQSGLHFLKVSGKKSAAITNQYQVILIGGESIDLQMSQHEDGDLYALIMAKSANTQAFLQEPNAEELKKLEIEKGVIKIHCPTGAASERSLIVESGKDLAGFHFICEREPSADAPKTFPIHLNRNTYFPGQSLSWLGHLAETDQNQIRHSQVILRDPNGKRVHSWDLGAMGGKYRGEFQFPHSSMTGVWALQLSPIGRDGQVDSSFSESFVRFEVRPTLREGIVFFENIEVDGDVIRIKAYTQSNNSAKVVRWRVHSLEEGSRESFHNSSAVESGWAQIVDHRFQLSIPYTEPAKYIDLEVEDSLIRLDLASALSSGAPWSTDLPEWIHTTSGKSVKIYTLHGQDMVPKDWEIYQLDSEPSSMISDFSQLGPIARSGPSVAKGFVEKVTESNGLTYRFDLPSLRRGLYRIHVRGENGIQSSQHFLVGEGFSGLPLLIARGEVSDTDGTQKQEVLLNVRKRPALFEIYSKKGLLQQHLVDSQRTLKIELPASSEESFLLSLTELESENSFYAVLMPEEERSGTALASLAVEPALLGGPSNNQGRLGRYSAWRDSFKIEPIRLISQKAYRFGEPGEEQENAFQPGLFNHLLPYGSGEDLLVEWPMADDQGQEMGLNSFASGAFFYNSWSKPEENFFVLEGDKVDELVDLDARLNIWSSARISASVLGNHFVHAWRWMRKRTEKAALIHLDSQGQLYVAIPNLDQKSAEVSLKESSKTIFSETIELNSEEWTMYQVPKEAISKGEGLQVDIKQGDLVWQLPL